MKGVVLPSPVLFNYAGQAIAAPAEQSLTSVSPVYSGQAQAPAGIAQ